MFSCLLGEGPARHILLMWFQHQKMETSRDSDQSFLPRSAIESRHPWLRSVVKIWPSARDPCSWKASCIRPFSSTSKEGSLATWWAYRLWRPNCCKESSSFLSARIGHPNSDSLSYFLQSLSYALIAWRVVKMNCYDSVVELSELHSWTSSASRLEASWKEKMHC